VRGTAAAGPRGMERRGEMNEKENRKKEKEGVKVVDKRKVRIDSAGEVLNREEDAGGEERAGAAQDEPSGGAEAFGREAAGGEFAEKMDFVTFILSMSQTALLSLGFGPNPETGKVDCDLRSAKFTIDILEVLQEKTKGNLTGEEERILDRILTELRLMWVQKKRQTDGMEQ
jgi:hypothetical protein